MCDNKAVTAKYTYERLSKIHSLFNLEQVYSDVGYDY